MRAGLLLLLACVSAWAQLSYSFESQPSRVPGLSEFRAVIKNDAPIAVQVQGLDVLAAAAHPPPATAWQPIRWVGNAGIQKAVDKTNKHGLMYYAGIACEVGGYMGSITLTGKLGTMKEKAAVAFPIGAGLCSIGRMLWTREHPKIEIPADLLPGIFVVPANGRADYAIYGW